MKAKVDEAAKRYLKHVRPTGERGLRATCPLCGHARTFLISSDTGGWVCFSCKSSGGFLQLFIRMGLPRAIVDQIRKELDLVYSMPEHIRRLNQVSQRRASYILPEYILAAFQETPAQMLDLGFTPEILRNHDVGYDARLDRVTFPIRDVYGRLVAISGRACKKTEPIRYLVYRSGKVGDELWGVADSAYAPLNRDHLYGYNTVFPRLLLQEMESRKSPVIIVEGFKGCLWLQQLGFENTVGLMGSSITEAQRALISKVKGPYYLLLDHEPGKAFPDDRGDCSAITIAKRLQPFGQVYLCLYPGWEDTNPYKLKPKGTSPDDLCTSEIENMLKGAQSHSQLVVARRTDTWKRGE